MDTFITIVDSAVGRRPGGHQEDYLVALEGALRDCRATTLAPFRGESAAAAIHKQQPRWRQYWDHLRALRSLIRRGEQRLLVFPNPDFRDFVIFFTAIQLRMKPRCVIALFVLRRNATGIVGQPGRKVLILTRLVRNLARSGHLYPVSDAHNALRDWCRLTGTNGSLVTIPVRERPPGNPLKMESDPVVFGLLGLYRPEKGIEHYDLIVRATLSLPLPVRIRIQLPDLRDCMRDSQARDLQESWKDRAEVQISFGHLDTDAYTRLVSDVDVLILPYDVAQYGTGTSGVMFEALQLGAVVVSTRFEWAVDTFANQPRVVWLDAVNAAFLAQALREAAKLALEERKERRPVIATGGEFATSWRDAIAAAQACIGG